MLPPINFKILYILLYCYYYINFVDIASDQVPMWYSSILRSLGPYRGQPGSKYLPRIFLKMSCTRYYGVCHPVVLYSLSIMLSYIRIFIVWLILHTLESCFQPIHSRFFAMGTLHNVCYIYACTEYCNLYRTFAHGGR